MGINQIKLQLDFVFLPFARRKGGKGGGARGRAGSVTGGGGGRRRGRGREVGREVNRRRRTEGGTEKKVDRERNESVGERNSEWRGSEVEVEPSCVCRLISMWIWLDTHHRTGP